MSKEVQEYKDAVWQFLIEHSDLSPTGSLFVKFHVTDRQNFENRVNARYQYGYKRNDTRLNLTPEEKNELHVRLRRTKKEVNEKWKADKAERRRIMDQVKAQNERNRILEKYPKPLRPFINTLLTLYATARTTVIQYKQVGARHLGSAPVKQSPKET